MLNFLAVAWYALRAAWRAQQTGWLASLWKGINAARELQAAVGSVPELSCTFHELPRCWGFYIMVPFSCVLTTFPGSASFGRPTVQFVCSDWLCPSGNKGGQSGCCVFLCPICQKSVAQTMQQLPGAQQSLSAVECLSLSCRNHNSNYKSCFVSRWIMQC